MRQRRTHDQWKELILNTGKEGYIPHTVILDILEDWEAERTQIHNKLRELATKFTDYREFVKSYIEITKVITRSLQ